MNNTLSHFGILGMKWGVRRYQNPDGSLTPEGQKRYSKDYEYASKLKKKDSKSLSNRELKSLNNRLELERKLQQNTNMSKLTLSKVSKTIGSVSAIFMSAAAIKKVISKESTKRFISREERHFITRRLKQL